MRWRTPAAATTTDSALKTPVDTPHSLWLIGLYRLFVASFLLWLGTIAPGDPGFVPASTPGFQFVAAGYLAFAMVLAVLARESAQAPAPLLEYQVIGGALGDILAISLVLLTAGGVETGLGLLLIPAVAATAAMTSGRISLFVAALATLMLLITELVIGPKLAWAFTPAPTQTGLLGATLFVAVIMVWRLARRAGISEDQLARQEEDLASLAELNAQIVARMGAGVIAVERNGRIRSINEAARRLLPPRAGRTLQELSPRLADALRQWQREPRLPLSVQFPGDAEQTELEVRLAPLGFAGEQGTLLILEDATEIKRKAHASKLQSLGKLTASIAHEIRNPLGAISHSAQLLAESPQLTVSDKRLLEIIQNQSARVDQVIRNVLSLSRGRPAERGRLVLLERLERFAEEFCGALQLRRDALHIRVTPPDAEVLFDPLQLNQVLWNLCHNARVHGGHDNPGQGPIVLRGGAGQISRAATLDVIDAGPGILPAQLEDLFEPFRSHAPGGTGLGLYISRLLCENNGAALEYVQHPQGGCFRILFAPVDDGSSPAERGPPDLGDSK
ncbi:sensor histidine kinase [Thioalkalivibrio nitratireducens]|uniref:sensor histidine kinase n=1 Tax=Thioalkalivibrio nitratireducens TaxID=186931 RepID=UPI0005C26398|nr:ATP-binding protein [Thioalkalivibrio nitratireducens]